MSTAPCYREPTNGVHFTRNTHRHDCTDPDCRGCVTCEARHCEARRNCTWHLAEGELACGRCIGGARRDLRTIGDLSSLLLTAAIADGLESEAANLAGPACDAEAWTWRKVAARQGAAWHVSLVEDDDEHHPGRVLGTWQRMIAEDYGHDDLPTSLAGAIGYLDRTLHRVAHDDGQDFPLLRRELRKCRQHLEAVLHNDDRPERGAPCPECRDTGDGVVRLVRHHAHWCDAPDCARIHYADESGDVWRCPRNHDHEWSHEDYSRWVMERRKARTA